jgi:transcriptional regulator EpsA
VHGFFHVVAAVPPPRSSGVTHRYDDEDHTCRNTAFNVQGCALCAQHDHEGGCMATSNVWNFRRADKLLGLLRRALTARSREDWSRWVQVDMQDALPHDVLLAAWGDFKSGAIGYDVISRTPALLNDALPRDIIEPLMRILFHHWLQGGQEPVAIDTRPLRSVGSGLFSASPIALAHGVQDHRSRFDCLYAFVGPSELASPSCAQLCRMALPFIDTGFRQLVDRGGHLTPADPPPPEGAICSFSQAWGSTPRVPLGERAGNDDGWNRAEPKEGNGTLTARELEVMQWVRIGKTNPEIASILNISTFTVKNHMRRIYSKMDVLNRAQAVGSFDSMARKRPRVTDRPSASARPEERP